MESMAPVREIGSTRYIHREPIGSWYVLPSNRHMKTAFADQEPSPAALTVGEIGLSVFNLAKLPSIRSYLLEQMVVEKSLQILNTLKVTTPVYVACSAPAIINVGATLVIAYKAWLAHPFNFRFILVSRCYYFYQGASKTHQGNKPAWHDRNESACYFRRVWGNLLLDLGMCL